MLMNIMISDHKATYVSIQINIKLSNSYYREVWNYKNPDFKLINNKVEAFNRDTLIKDTSTFDQACVFFTNRFIDLCNKCISRRNVLRRQNDKLWFTPEQRYNTKLRDRLRKRYLKIKTEVDRLSYKRQRNKVNNIKLLLIR